MKKIKWMKYLLPIGILSITTPLFLTSCDNANNNNNNDSKITYPKLTNYNQLKFQLNQLELDFIGSHTQYNKYVIIPLQFQNLSDNLTPYNTYNINPDTSSISSIEPTSIINSNNWNDEVWFVNTYIKYMEVGLNKITFNLYYDYESGTNNPLYSFKREPITYIFKIFSI